MQAWAVLEIEAPAALYAKESWLRAVTPAGVTVFTHGELAMSVFLQDRDVANRRQITLIF